MKGYDVTIASIAGGEIPFDPASKEGEFLTPEAKQFLQDGEVQQCLSNSKSVEQVLGTDSEQYDALFLPGGHGIMYDGPQSNELKLLIETFWASGKVVSAVCHGPAALITVSGPDGNLIIKGKKVSAFSNSEEQAVQKQDCVPFLLEDKLKELGAMYEKAETDWAPHVVRDGKLVTGQNPASSKPLAEAVADLLSPPLDPVHGKKEGFHHRPVSHASEHHHDHTDEHPRPGMKVGQPVIPEQQHRSSWHQTYRPPI